MPNIFFVTDRLKRATHVRTKVNKNKEGIIWGININDCKLSNLSPLKDMSLEAISCSGNLFNDLSPLKGMKLKQFICTNTPIKDLSSLTGMPIWKMDIIDTEVTDLTPLKGMKLQMLGFTPSKITRGIDVLRGMESIFIYTTPTKKGTNVMEVIGVKEFFEKYEKGDYKMPE